jgi:hypothetical protein
MCSCTSLVGSLIRIDYSKYIVVVLLQLNCNEYSYVKGVQLLKSNFITGQSVVDTGSSDITRLPLLVPVACQDFVFEQEREEIGRRERAQDKVL